MTHLEDYKPNYTLGGSGSNFLTYALGLLGALIVGLGLWYFVAPESVAKFFARFQSKSLEIESLSLIIGNNLTDLPPNSSIEIHPAQRFGISKLSTNRWHNYDLKLSSKEIDIKAISNGTLASTHELMPEENFEDLQEIHIIVSDKKEQVAEFQILSRYSVLDFIARGDVAKDPIIKAEYYLKAYQLDPTQNTSRNKLFVALNELGQENAAQAAAFYENIIAQNISGGETILMQLASLYEAENKTERLIDVLERLVSEAESNNDSEALKSYRQRLAEALAKSGAHSEAAKNFEKLLLKAKDEEKTYYITRLAGLYYLSGDTDKEINYLKKLNQLVTSDQAAKVWSEVASVYIKTGKNQENKAEALSILGEKLPDGEAKANIYKIIGQITFKENKYSQAKDAYQKALIIKPKDLNILANLARLAHLEKDNAAYITYLEKIVSLEENNIDYRKNLADALAKDKQNNKAKAQYEELIKRNPDDFDIRISYINFLDKISDKKTLIEQYGILAQKNPKNEIIPYNLGVAYFEQKNWAKAIEAFKQALEISPKDISARKYLLLAYQRQNSRADIIREAMLLYELNPSDKIYLSLIFNTLENAKDWQGYAEAAKKLCEIQSDKSRGWEELYKAQIKLNQTEEAAESLWQIAARTKEADAAKAWLRAADMLSSAGKKDKAKEAYQNVLKIDPENAKATRALRD